MRTWHNSKYSRRDFLKKMGAGAAAMVAAQLLAAEKHPVFASGCDCDCESQQSCGMLIDLTRCVGCNSCALACKSKNDLPEADVEPRALSSEAYTFVDYRAITGKDGEIETRGVKRQCMHCLNAACVSACPAAAMYKSEEGPVIYRAERCLGCRYCQMACPFGVPAFEWDNGLAPVISKCWLCYDRLQEGLKPACAEACPAGALHFDKRDKLLAEAHAIIDTHPDRYINHIFGEHEVGGTSVLYLSDVPFEQMGFPVNLPFTAPPEETEKIMHALPYVIAGMTVLMTGTATFTHLRAHISQEQDNQQEEEQAA